MRILNDQNPSVYTINIENEGKGDTRLFEFPKGTSLAELKDIVLENNDYKDQIIFGVEKEDGLYFYAIEADDLIPDKDMAGDMGLSEYLSNFGPGAQIQVGELTGRILAFDDERSIADLLDVTTGFHNERTANPMLEALESANVTGVSMRGGANIKWNTSSTVSGRPQTPEGMLLDNKRKTERTYSDTGELLHEKVSDGQGSLIEEHDYTVPHGAVKE